MKNIKKTANHNSSTSSTSAVMSYIGRAPKAVYHYMLKIWKKTFGSDDNDWLFLAALATVMAFISFIMEVGINICIDARLWVYRDLAGDCNVFVQYLAWLFIPICLILISSGFAQVVAPESYGSGVPEVKTVLRGVVLKQSLSFRTLVTKVFCLTASLGSGLPLGKLGPHVHISSMVATLLSKAVTSFRGVYENKNRYTEMLAVACAVAAACVFAAPIGGVLFSVEATTAYFAVRNYWRAFFATVFSAMVFRLLAVWFLGEETLTPLFNARYSNYPYEPMELLVFAMLGVVSGLLGGLMVRSQRKLAQFLSTNTLMKAMRTKWRLMYPFLFVFVFSSLAFPPGLGKFMGGHLSTPNQVKELLSNFSFVKPDPTLEEFQIIENWRTTDVSVLFGFVLFAIYSASGCVIGTTVPIPCGLFVPTFKAGAGLGRVFGEVMVLIFPEGLQYGNVHTAIRPVGYALAGAAALSGAFTQTISTALIAFESTGQMTHIIPVLVSTIIANAVAKTFECSVYDSIIRIKKLPYLPDILPLTAGAYHSFVEDFMVRNVKYIWYGMTYRDLKNILINNKKTRAFPLVDSPGSMILLGSIGRKKLIALLKEHIDRRAVGTLTPEAETSFSRNMGDSIENVDELENGKILDKERWNKSKSHADDDDDDDINVSIPLLTSEDKNGQKSEDDESAIFMSDHRLSVTLPQSTTVKASTDVSQSHSAGELSHESEPSAHTVLDSTKAETSGRTALETDSVETPENQFTTKSILKKTFRLGPTSSTTSASQSPPTETSVHAGDSKLHHTIEALIRKRSFRRLNTRSCPKLSDIFPPLSPTKSSGKSEEELWEQQQEIEEALDTKVAFRECQIDPSPYQLVERTSLMKVHSLFSLLSLDHAYVTAIGRLIGVVTLEELRKAIEDTNLGVSKLPSSAQREEENTSEGRMMKPINRAD